MSPQHQVQQSSTDFLPQVSEGPEEPSQAPGEIKAETFVACGSPKQKNSSRRNAWGNLSYADLITQAIKSAPEQRLTLSQIYEWVVKNVPYFKDKGDSASSSGWKVSFLIRLIISDAITLSFSIQKVLIKRSQSSRLCTNKSAHSIFSF